MNKDMYNNDSEEEKKKRHQSCTTIECKTVNSFGRRISFSFHSVPVRFEIDISDSCDSFARVARYKRHICPLSLNEPERIVQYEFGYTRVRLNSVQSSTKISLSALSCNSLDNACDNLSPGMI